ncbi:hypothetical protein CHISP_2903 [Chitinispirillum alkaliphilum]|nr:hypothetical protein CHISP_2903 [Chitinispirillum alkaliphilum]
MTILHKDLDWSVRSNSVKKRDAQKSVPPEDTPPKFVTGVENDEPQHKEKPQAEVRLISAEWKPGTKGFTYNEKCFVEVKAEYLKKNIRAKVRGDLFGIYDGQEHDLLHEVTGFIGDDGIALMEIKHLWFIDDHYFTWQKDKSTPCQYKVKKHFPFTGGECD